MEADIAVHLHRPRRPDLKVVKLGRMHFMFFAARSHLAAHGVPANASDLAGHRMLVFSDDAGTWEEHWRRVFGEISPTGPVVLRNNVASAHFVAILQGGGMGAMGTFVQSMGVDLAPLDIDIDTKCEIWLSYRPEAKRIARIRKTIDWLIQIYDPRRFPWFRDEFIPPGRLPPLYKNSALSNDLRLARDRR